jgi:hypothetical protein
MRSKVTFIAGFATGYILGSKAGRSRYDQIREAARTFANNPAVQGTANTIGHQATDVLATAKDKAAGKVGDKWQERKPAWLGHGSVQTDEGTAHGVAGSNGQF